MSKNIKAKVIEQDGGYFFPEFDIHVVAKSELAARQFVKSHYGFNPDEELAAKQKMEQDREKLNSEKTQSDVG